MTTKKYEIGQHLKDISIDDKEWNDFDMERIKSYSPFMMNKCVSTVDMYMPFIDELNQYNIESKKAHFNAISSFVPKRKMFFKFINAKKDKNKDLRVLISEVFKVGSRDTDEILEMITPEQEKGLREMFGGRRR